MSIYDRDLLTGKTRLKTAIARIRTFCSGKKTLVAFSGGKDSQCCYHLCEDAGIDFTAQEMRSKADEFKEYLDNPNHFAVKEFDNESRVLMEMLYQAADAMERERKYEYVLEFRYCGKWKVYKDGLTLADALKISSEPWRSPHRIVRREVGKREVISWG